MASKVEEAERQGKEKPIQPRHKLAYTIFRNCMTILILAGILLVAGIVLLFIPSLRHITGNTGYRLGLLGIAGISVLIIIFSFLIHIIFLKKPPFDDWVLDIAAGRIGTEKIYYDKKYIWIEYDRKNKEVDKKDFVVEMSDKSNKYSYYYIKTFVDEGVLQVECRRKAVVPTSATFKSEDDTIWNAFPIGLARDDINQAINPVAWKINDNNKRKDLVKTEPSTSILITGGTGSGKSVLEQSIVGHVSRFADHFQVVGVDCKRVEFNLLAGVKGIKSVALDQATASEAIGAFRQIMMDRFKFMEDQKVNNIYKLKNIEVDYYEIFGEKFQFDELFELQVELTEDMKDYNKLILAYPDGIQPKIMTIEQIYKDIRDNKWKNPRLREVKGYNSYITEKDFKISKGIFKPKALLFLADEMNELMDGDNYKAQENLRYCFAAISRLGRAAAVHLALAAQKASSSVISSELKNNIQQSIVLGDFDAGISTMMFDKD